MQNDGDKVLVWRHFNEKNLIYSLYNLLFLLDLFKTPTGSFNSLKPMVKNAIGIGKIGHGDLVNEVANL